MPLPSPPGGGRGRLRRASLFLEPLPGQGLAGSLDRLLPPVGRSRVLEPSWDSDPPVASAPFRRVAGGSIGPRMGSRALPCGHVNSGRGGDGPPVLAPTPYLANNKSDRDRKHCVSLCSGHYYLPRASGLTLGHGSSRPSAALFLLGLRVSLSSPAWLRRSPSLTLPRSGGSRRQTESGPGLFPGGSYPEPARRFSPRPAPGARRAAALGVSAPPGAARSARAPGSGARPAGVQTAALHFPCWRSGGAPYWCLREAARPSADEEVTGGRRTGSSALPW